MNEQILAQYESALKDVDSALTAAGIPHWIEYGTLLAAWRDKKPMHWDMEDIDFGVRWEDLTEEKNQKLTKILTDKGFLCDAPPVSRYSFQRCYRKWGLHVDIWIFHKLGDFYYKTWYLRDNTYEHLVQFTKYYDNLSIKINYCGKEFFVPNLTERYLSLMYGKNWKSPLPTDKYNDRKKSHNAMIYRRFVDFMHGQYDEEKYILEDY